MREIYDPLLPIMISANVTGFDNETILPQKA